MKPVPIAPDLRTDPAARSVRKRPIPVVVEIATTPGELQTLEGPVRFRAEDALITGVQGERWPVARERFDATYEAVPPTVPGASGLYLKRPVTVLARQMDKAFAVRVGYAADPLQGQPGDWLLQYAPGEYGVVSAAVFGQTYEGVG
jgi:PGDYG protein